MDNRDWPIESMVQEALDHIKEEQEKYPLGLKGAMLLLFHTEDRYDASKTTDDKPYLAFHSGLSLEEQLQLLDRVKTGTIKSIFRAIRDEDKNKDE